MKPQNPDELWLEYQPLAELVRRMWSENPKAHDVDGIELSISKYRFNAPPSISESQNLLVAGHGRIITLEKLKKAAGPPPGHITLLADGDWGVPVIRGLTFDTADDFEEYVLTDNALTIAEGWDDPKLGPIIKRMSERRVPLTSLGWKQSSVASILRRHAPVTTLDAPEPSEALRKKWRTEVGQLWLIPSARTSSAEHAIICGDARDAAVLDALMGGLRARWFWTDPPYGVAYVGGAKKRKKIAGDETIAGASGVVDAAFANVDRFLDDSPLYVASAAGRAEIAVGNLIMARWNLHQILMWEKNGIVLGRSDYRGQHEVVLYGWKGTHRWYGGRDKSTVMKHDRPNKSDYHPTEKPPQMIVDHLNNSTTPGEVGIDCFCGSGSTLVAAEIAGRVCRGVELLPEYVAVILERAAQIGLAPRLSTSVAPASTAADPAPRARKPRK